MSIAGAANEKKKKITHTHTQCTGPTLTEGLFRFPPNQRPHLNGVIGCGKHKRLGLDRVHLCREPDGGQANLHALQLVEPPTAHTRRRGRLTDGARVQALVVLVLCKCNERIRSSRDVAALLVKQTQLSCNRTRARQQVQVSVGCTNLNLKPRRGHPNKQEETHTRTRNTHTQS